MKLIIGWDAAVARWVGEHLGIHDFGPCTAIGIIDGKGELIGGVVYNNYRHPNIEATIASTTPRWCQRQIMAAIFAYPFRQLGCARITAVTEHTNRRARAFLRRVGFREEGVMRRGFCAADAVIHGMLADECRWLDDKRGPGTDVERGR